MSAGHLDSVIAQLEGEIATKQKEIAIRQAALDALRALDSPGEAAPAPERRSGPPAPRAAAVSPGRPTEASQDDDMTRRVLLAMQTSSSPLSSTAIQAAAKLTSVPRQTVTEVLKGLVSQKRVITEGFGRWTTYRVG